MIRACFVPRAASLALALGLFGAIVPASAMDPKTEQAAKKLQADAMDVDFLGLELKKARKKLEDALKKCGKDKCSKPVVATLHRDLGVVMINAGDKAGGGKAFAAAFAHDPNVALGKDFLGNPEVKKAWEAAKKKGGGGASSDPEPTGGGGGDSTPAVSADGGLTVKTTLAPVGYELPIVISVPGGLAVSVLKLSYKTDDMEKYKTVEAKKSGGKWMVLLPCDLTQKVGTIKMYAKAYDDGSSELEHWATIKKPAVIKIVDSMPDDVESPTLPGNKEPKECREGGSKEGGADGEHGGKADGSGCKEDDECEKGLACVENDAGKKWCKPGEKKSRSGGGAKLWIGLDFQQDIVLLGAEKDLCKQSTWACSVNTADGRRDVTTSSSQGIRVGNTGGKTDGGAAFATKRIIGTFDYFVAPQLALGGRLGIAFGGNPTDSAKFVPFHLEARLQYFIVEGAFRPYFMVAGGYMRTDPPVPNVIVEPQDPAFATACSPAGFDPPDCGGKASGSNPVLKGVTAYKLAGPGFVAAGIGAWLMPTSSIAVNIGFKGVFPLPVFAFTISPEIGVKIGF